MGSELEALNYVVAPGPLVAFVIIVFGALAAYVVVSALVSAGIIKKPDRHNRSDEASEERAWLRLWRLFIKE